ncbi:MAG: PorT family protein [Kiritimatiellae bacterium]|nr:PorT family protein [Kiritimatiellia bacterium]
MKIGDRRMLIAGTLVLALSSSFAEGWRAGARGGLAVPRLRGGGNEISRGYESILAPNFGLTVERDLDADWSVALELVYSVQGGERDELQPITADLPGLPPLPPGRYLYADFESRSELEYLEIPLLLKWRAKLADQWHFVALAGPYAGFLLHAEQETSGTSLIYLDRGRTPLLLAGRPLPPVSFDRSTDVTDDLHTFNWGLTGGVGLLWDIGGPHRVSFEVRGQYGFREVQKDKANGESNTGAALFLLGYQYRFAP